MPPFLEKSNLITIKRFLVNFCHLCNTLKFKYKNYNLTHYMKDQFVTIWLFITSVFLQFPHLSEAQFSDMKFEHLTVNDGLSYNGVKCIVRDSKGYLWLGTERGLNQYDGVKIRVYENIESQTNSLSDRDINCIFEDRDENLWIGTANGLNLYDRKSDSFIRYFSDSSDYKSISNNYITSILQDQKDNLWINTAKGLNHFSIKNQTFTHYFAPGSANKLSRYQDHISFDKQENIWGMHGATLWQFYIQTKQFKSYNNPLLANANVQNAYVEVDMLGIVWIGINENGLISFNRNTKTFKKYSNTPDGKGINSGHLPYMVLDSNQELLIAGSGGGISKLNMQNNSFEYYINDLNNPNCILGGSVMAIYKDKEGIFYAGSAGGLNIYNPKKYRFTTYQHVLNEPNSLINNFISRFFEDSEGLIWISSEGGISIFNPKNKLFKNYILDISLPNGVLNNITTSFAEDKNGDIWVGTYGEGIQRYNKKTGGYYRYLSNSNDPTSVSYNYILDLVSDNRGRLLISYYPSGLDIFDIKQGVVKKFRHSATEKYSIPDTWIDIIHPINESEFGLITPKGYGVFNINTGTCKWNEALNGTHVIDIYYDKAGNLWVATFKKGLWKISPTGEVYKYNIANGFPSNTISGILSDKHDNIWIAYSSGICQYNNKNKTFRHFSLSDGLQKSYKSYAHLKASNGFLYFGGTNGFNTFSPDSIKINTYKPSVYIDEFQIFNKPVTLFTPNSPLTNIISETKEITLSYRQSVFSFGFTAINFTSPEKALYAYKMVNFDKDWNYTDATHRKATYTNLDPGNYIFMVKASNNDGVWNELPTNIKIVILPPWWKTVWFRMLLLFSVVGGVFGFYFLRVNALTRYQRVLENKVKKRTLQLQEANAMLEERQEEITQQRDEIENQYTNIHTLTEIGQKITSSIKVQEIIKRVYISINSLMDAPSFSIGQINDSTKTIDYWGYSQMDNPMHFDTVGLSDEQRMSVWCVNHKQVVFMNDVENEVRKYFNKRIKGYTGDDLPKSSIYLPLLSFEQNVIGIITVKSYNKNAYTNFHLNVLKNLAAYISIALDNARVYNELEAQSEKIKEMDMLKTRFFINISHEFRTPLTLILGPVESMITEFKKNQWNDSVSKLELVNRNAKRLLSLINQLIEIHKIESGAMYLKVVPTEIISFVNEIASLFNDLIAQQNITLSLPNAAEAIEVFVDREKMEKVIFNLLSNAIKYNKLGGCINIDIKIENHQLKIENFNGFAEIQISDTGIGIDSKSAMYIFEPFYQAQNMHTQIEESSGIGLSLCKSLVELHHGNIEVSSELGKGSTFTVNLPLGKEHFKPEEIFEMTNDNLQIKNDRLPTISPKVITNDKLPKDNKIPTPNFKLLTSDIGLRTSDFKLQTILVVDDNADMRTYIKGELNSQFQIIEAADGAEGLEKATKYNPTLIISDVMMPGIDGIEFCKNIKTNELISHIPVILLTAKNSEESTIEGLNSGADEYITKPFSVNILLSRIKNILQTRENLRKLYARNIIVQPKEITVNNTDELFLEKVLKIVEENIDNPDFTVVNLASETGMSRNTLLLKLKAITGENVNDFITSMRMKRAAQLLLQTNLNVAEIAYMVGFKTPTYFTKCFKDTYEKTPSEYRTV